MANQLLTQATNNNILETVGKVAKDKEPNSRWIKVFVKDLLPMYEGKLEPKTSDHQLTGNNYNGQITLTNCIDAEWMSDESNRRFPPDVKANEQVTVIIYTDQDKVYWKSKGRDDDLRRTERILTTAANTPENPAPIDQTNSYGYHIDTQDTKVLELYTSQSAGEAYKYVIKMDAKNSTIRMCDNSNNEFIIESEIPRVTMRNSDGCFVELAKKNITINAVEDCTVVVGRQLIFNTPVCKVINTKGTGVTVWEAAELYIKANAIIQEAKCIGLKGAVEVTSLVSAKEVWAAGYSTHEGKNVDTYRPAQVNEKAPFASRGNPSPNTNGGGGMQRHCAAWEDVQTAFNLVSGDLQKIDSKISYGNSSSAINGSATTAEMKVNTGK